MLNRLELRDFAIVERLDLELDVGVTVLTGETGAGKSILVDALGLALGERARQSMVRAGATRAEVVAVFDLPSDSPGGCWLREHELDSVDAECVLRRTVATDGRSRAYINDRSVPMQTLRDLGDLLVDIHGQHAHQSLLRRATQREALDAHANHPEALARVADLHNRWRELNKAAEPDQGGPAEREDRLEFLRYQLRELAELSPQPEELAQLDEEHRRLSHREDLRSVCARALTALEGDGGPSGASLLGAAARAVAEMCKFDSDLGEVTELVDSASIQVEEATGRLHRYAEQLDVDPGRLAAVDARLTDLHAAARKHRTRAEDLSALQDKLSEEIDFLEQSENRLFRLREELAAVESDYRCAAQSLHRSRQEAARGLADAVTANMAQLALEGGRFEVQLQADFDRPPGPHGADLVEFHVSANPGQPVRPLAQVASGGELSRISLAIQVLETRDSAVPTLIFDEVDAGIGARVADLVGSMLRSLASRRQVLCVTHLPQIAARADHHVIVEKHTGVNSTSTRVRHVREEARVDETARMLGGVDITEQTIAHAREMLERS